LPPPKTGKARGSSQEGKDSLQTHPTGRAAIGRVSAVALSSTATSSLPTHSTQDANCQDANRAACCWSSGEWEDENFVCLLWEESFSLLFLKQDPFLFVSNGITCFSNPCFML